MTIRELKNKLFADWLWDSIIIGGGCALIGLFTFGLIGLVVALITNFISWHANKIFELKDFCLRLIIPLIVIIHEILFK